MSSYFDNLFMLLSLGLLWRIIWYTIILNTCIIHRQSPHFVQIWQQYLQLKLNIFKLKYPNLNWENKLISVFKLWFGIHATELSVCLPPSSNTNTPLPHLPSTWHLLCCLCKQLKQTFVYLHQKVSFAGWAPDCHIGIHLGIIVIATKSCDLPPGHWRTNVYLLG